MSDMLFDISSVKITKVDYKLTTLYMQYYPYILASGPSGVVAMYATGIRGHLHFTRHHGTVCSCSI